MSDLASRVPVPPKGSFNTGLHAAKQKTMLELFGKPGELTKNCSPVSGPIARSIVMRDVGPFRVSGHIEAVASLAGIFENVLAHDPEVYREVKTAGMLCCRAVRGSTKNYSNHSWGTAIDLYFGSAVVPQGKSETQAGILRLRPFFQQAKWFWGAGFPRVDAMHFEVSEELLWEWKQAGRV